MLDLSRAEAMALWSGIIDSTLPNTDTTLKNNNPTKKHTHTQNKNLIPAKDWKQKQLENKRKLTYLKKKWAMELIEEGGFESVYTLKHEEWWWMKKKRQRQE